MLEPVRRLNTIILHLVLENLTCLLRFYRKESKPRNVSYGKRGYRDLLGAFYAAQFVTESSELVPYRPPQTNPNFLLARMVPLNVCYYLSDWPLACLVVLFPSVLYFSIHRYDHAQFFPFSTSANYDFVGCGDGKGYTVNVPWNTVNK